MAHIDEMNEKLSNATSREEVLGVLRNTKGIRLSVDDLEEVDGGEGIAYYDEEGNCWLVLPNGEKWCTYHAERPAPGTIKRVPKKRGNVW